MNKKIALGVLLSVLLIWGVFIPSIFLCFVFICNYFYSWKSNIVDVFGVESFVLLYFNWFFAVSIFHGLYALLIIEFAKKWDLISQAILISGFPIVVFLITFPFNVVIFYIFSIEFLILSISIVIVISFYSFKKCLFWGYKNRRHEDR